MSNNPKHINSFQLVRDIKDVNSIVLPINSILSTTSFTIASDSLVATLLPQMNVWVYRTNISASVSSVTYLNGINTIVLTSALPSEFLVGTKIKFNVFNGSLSGSKWETMHNWANSTSAGVSIPMSNELKLAKGFNYGYSFNGTTQYITHTPISFANGEQWSWCGFIDMSGDNYEDYITIRGYSVDINNNISVDTNRDIVYRNALGDYTIFTNISNATLHNIIKYITITSKKDLSSIYVNGVFYQTVSTSISNAIVLDQLCKNRNITNTQYKGKYLRDQIFNYALPAERVFELWNNGRPDIYDGMVYSNNANLIINGTFASDNDWTKGTNWTIASNVAHAERVTALQELTPSVTVNTTVNYTYILTYTISGYVSGSITAKLGTIAGTARTADGTYSEAFVCAASGDKPIFVGNDTTPVRCNIDDVKLALAGCLLDYAPDSITPSLWLDKSGNEMHGTLYGTPEIVYENVRNI